ncbi:hypothetical protein QBC41DRAFT_388649, partial [Cercophora samala]
PILFYITRDTSHQDTTKNITTQDHTRPIHNFKSSPQSHHISLPTQTNKMEGISCVRCGRQLRPDQAEYCSECKRKNPAPLPSNPYEQQQQQQYDPYAIAGPSNAPPPPDQQESSLYDEKVYNYNAQPGTSTSSRRELEQMCRMQNDQIKRAREIHYQVLSWDREAAHWKDKDKAKFEEAKTQSERFRGSLSKLENKWLSWNKGQVVVTPDGFIQKGQIQEMGERVRKELWAQPKLKLGVAKKQKEKDENGKGKGSGGGGGSGSGSGSGKKR